MKTRNTKHTERRKNRKIAAGVIAALLVVVMGLSTVAYAAGGGDLMRAVASLFGLNSSVETYAVENADTVVDPDTTNVWTDYTRPDGQPSTQNVGRIWTDKSVFNDTYTFKNADNAGLSGQTIGKGDSDFLVSLSALSSTSNLKEMVKTSQPLDIVLVLDTSGSMSGTKMTNLKNAANNFINATAENNRGLEQDQQTRLAIVQFASGANTEQQLNYVTDQNAQQYRNTIDGFRANGATYAEEGLQQAQNVLDRNGRDNVQQIVIFFTDGEPNHYNGFDNEVAAEAVNTAHEMKQSGTIIYAIGVMNGANASITDDDGFNEYMNGVSSNYPDATASGSNGGLFEWGYYNTTFGERAEGDYYKAASDPDSIEEIFDEISDEVQQGVGSGSPIVDESEEGNTDPGDLTFTDQLGSYMQVTGTYNESGATDKMQLAYGDQIYTSTSKTTEGNVDTYHFEGEVDGNAVYGAADLADLTVTVTRSNDLAKGDTVTVTLPASLLPMRNYDVDTDTNAMTVSSAYPVRLFYGVSLKDKAKEALKNPVSADYAAILQTQKSEDGKTIDFYSNNFTKGAADGSTTATFQPNAGNKFYYYTQDTTLYIDQSCQTEATRQNISRYDTLYWKDTYWVQTGDGVGEERSTCVAIQRGTAEWTAMESTGGYNGTYYIPAGTPRSDRPATMTDGKDQNNTGTAANVLNPSWIGNSVSQALGNNGKLSFDMPGSLEIKKTVDWGNASDSTKQNPDKNKFTFEITANVPADEGDTAELLNGTYNYYVGDGEDAAGQVAFTDGKAELTIKGGTTVRIDGMPAGAAFTVTEKGVGQNGWTVTDGTTQQGASNDNKTDGIVTGTIESGSQVSLTFDNAYKAADINLNTNTTLSVKKDLKGRDWRDSDKFTFKIDGLGNTAGGSIATPEPAETTVTIDDQTEDYIKAFGDITFTAPGEYRYSITEDNDTDPINGIDYSAAIYRVVVTVTDDGNGKLVVYKVELQQTQNDAGTMGADAAPVPVGGSTATFTNTYDVNAATTNIDGRKVYNDTTGGNVIDIGKFTFQIEALGGYETEGGSSANYTVDAKDVPMPADVEEGTTTKQVTNTGYYFTFGSFSYDGNDAGKTFEYKVTEIAGNEQGMTYDGTEHIVKVKVEEVTTGEGTPEEETYLVATPDMMPAQVSFTNRYDPDDATLTGDSAIHGTKTFTGRDMKDDEKFYFQLIQISGPVVDADTGKQDMILDQPKIVEITKDEMQNGSADFNFGNMAFSRTGEYKFTVNEVAPDGRGGYTETSNGSGMNYDRNICTVTVTVTDNKKGDLVADVTYSNDVNATVTDKAQFNNIYEASMNYGAEGKGGIVVTKQLTNRPMVAGEFAFSITGVANDSGKTTVDDANKKLIEADTSFNNTAAAADQTITMAKLQNVSFDQTDAGKTYSYIVDETTEDDAKTLPGVNCDRTQYRVDIQVVDNGDGTMHTLTTVTKIKNAAGEDMTETVINAVNSDAQGYAAPTFGFVNEYNPNPATVGEDADDKIEVTKKVTGADSATDYTFTLTAQETEDGHISNIGGLNDSHQLTVTTDDTIKAGESQTKTFGNLTFIEPGTYTFTVQENQPDADEGWTFDDGNSDGTTDTHTVKVQVTDRNDDNEYDGNLYIANVIGSPVEINNSYKANPVIVGGDGADKQITVQKSVTGADSTDDFQFKIEPVDPKDNKWKNVEAVDEKFDPLTSITDGVKQNEPKTANFAGIQFNATGKYQFKITEVGAAEFNAGDNRNGWTYDEHEAIVTVNVTDDNFDGQLDATVSYENNAQAAEFTNKYEAASTTLKGEKSFKGTKKIEGRNGIEDETFGFTLAKGTVSDGGDWSKVTFKSGDDEATLFDTVKATAIMSEESNSAEFFFDGTFTFSKAGIYTFKVTETSHNDEAMPGDGTNGMTYDRHTGTITVTVTDDGLGNLNATAAPGEDDASTTFVNKYAAAPVTATGDTALQLTKKVTGAPALSEFDFNVKITDGDINNVKLGSGDNLTDLTDTGFTVSTTGLFNEDANTGMQDNETVGFGDITFTAVGDYTFTVTENTTTDQAGWTYASGGDNAKTITVHVTDEGFDGQLDIAEEDGIDGNNPIFTNKYEAGSITTGTDNGINVQKTLTGRDWQESDSFEFVLEAVDNAPMPEGDGNKVTITNESDPKTAVFDGITYNTAGEYKYTVKETKDDLGGVTYDEHEVNVTVTIADENYDGFFEVKSVVYDNSGAITDADKAVDKAAAFTNTYAASSTTLSGAENLKVEKELTGRDWIASDSFTFTLAGAGDITNNAIDDGIVVLPDPAEITISGNTGDHAATFEDITFTKAGTYTFTVTESGDVPGVINDPKAVRTITVKVTDNNDGTLTAEVVGGESEDLKFTNTYDPGTITLTGDSALKVQKTLRGREWADGEAYSFTIKSTSAPEGVAAEDIPMPGETEINIGKPADGNVNTATFGDMTFSQAGEYVYEITEVIPEAAEENMTYDGYHVTVTIIVAEDQAAGELTAHVTYNNGDQKVDDDNNNNERNNNDDEFVTDAAAFTNVKSVETTYNLEGTKVIEGRDFQEGDAFTFELRAVDKAPLPKDGENIITSVTIDQDDVREDEVNTADISFGKITFTEPGQYVYKISEIEPEEADRIEGMTYDTAERSVIIEVTADEQGNMTAKMIEPADGLVWTNTWADDTEPVLSGLTGTKNLTGTAMAEGQFTFLIQPQGNAPMGDSMMAAFNGEVTQNEDGSYTAPISLLNNVTYTENGDYVYIISEVNDGQRGITYDTTKYRVTVHVDGGNVTTGIESTTDEAITGDTEWTEAEAIVFNNSYTTSLNYNTAGGLSIIKNLKGHDIAADQFGFTVKAADDASREKAGFKEMSQNYATSASRMNGNGVSTDSMSVFGDIAFTQADAGKTYTYTISETTGGNTDAGYTNDTRTYTVEITTADDGKGSLTVTTQVTSDQGDEATYTYSNKAGTDQPAVVTFDNTYEASGGIGGEGQVSIIAKKELANSTLNGDDFTFTITDEAGKEVASGTNDASGTITFSEIDYTKDSLIADVASGAAVYSQVDGKDTYTYQYTVAETGDMPDGVSQVAASFQIQVTVTDNNDGTLSAAVTYPEGSEDGLVFRNTYGSEAEAQINVAGKKILNVESGDNVPDITHKYRFTITGADEDGNQAPLPGNTTVANDATGSVTFGDIVYTMENVFGNDPVTESVDEVSGETTEATADVHTDEAQTDDVQTDEAQTDEASGAVSEEADNTADNVRGAERTKTFYYTVTEAGSVAGVTNDPDAKPFTVTVKDNGDGTLSVESSATAGAQFEFVNTYSVDPTDPESPTDPDAEGGVTITKVLEGRDLKEGEFQFTMTGIAGTISEGMSVSGQNDAEGNVVLGGLVFEAPGTYEFNISEVIPDTLLGGVTYDGHIYTALANVKDNGDGTLSVAWTVSNGTETVDQITFTNTYKADAVGNVILQATKKLEGRDLKDGEFTFQLKDENGEVISEAANTVNGSVRFDALSFDKAGTYNYTVSEVKGNDDTITYDDTVYNVTVTVTDDLQGHLVATVTGEGGNELNMTFNNKYTKPAEPQNPDDDGTPKAVQTGDTTPIIPAVIAVLVSLAAIAAVVVLIMRRRRR